MKKIIILSTIAAALGLVASAPAQSWGFTLGNGAGFFFGKQACAPAHVAPVYYQQPVVVYQQPRTVYMQPYQQMREVHYQPTVIYRSEPVVIRRVHGHCR